ncbi:MAG TPA: 4'-phosphopantetheinyl transferase superfamily protein [Candidatus Angelobacter sp.]
MRRTQPLSPGRVDIWSVDLSLPEQHIQRCRSVLCEEENQRAGHFHFARDRNRFIAARTAMRTILAQYLNAAPQDVALVYSARGKPELAPELNESGLRFNLSHSRDCALLAVTLHSAVGADIESIRQEIRTDEIAKHYLSRGEVNALLAVPPNERRSAFFSCWTRKEAYIKAVGAGLSLALDSFDVAFGPGVAAALLRVDEDPQEILRWRMYGLSAPPGYAAALVVEGKEHCLQQRVWDWQEMLSRSVLEVK